MMAYPVIDLMAQGKVLQMGKVVQIKSELEGE